MLFRRSDSSCVQVEISDNLVPSSAIVSLRVARRGLIVYFVLLVLLSAFTNWFAVATASDVGIFFVMWSPGVAALLTRLIFRENPIRFAGKALDGRKIWLAIGVAVVTPLVVGLIAYGLAWTTGLARLVDLQPSEDWVFGLTVLGNLPPWLMIPLLVLAFLVVEVVSAAGEEIGWRGYMLTRLIAADVPRPILVGGLIWSFWHWPLILLESNHLNVSLLLSACIFVVTITCLGFVSARLRLQTGSIWPSIALHAAWNCCILELFDAATSNSDTSFWIGESGVLVALVMVMMAYIFWHGRDWKMRYETV